MESFAGIDRRRSLPELHRQHFRKWFARRAGSVSPGVSTPGGSRPRLAESRPSRRLLHHLQGTANRPRRGRRCSKRAGFTVELAGVCCGRAMIWKGFLTDARRLAKDGIAKLDRLRRGRHADPRPGTELHPHARRRVAGTGPRPGREARRGRRRMADAWLGTTSERQRTVTRTCRPAPGKVLFHGHCHQKALVGAKGRPTRCG